MIPVFSTALTSPSPTILFPATSNQWTRLHPPDSLQRSATKQPGPNACPPNQLFVTPDLKSEVIQWAHTSKVTCQLGIQRFHDVLLQRFLRSTLEKDTRTFLMPVQSATSTSHPTSFLLVFVRHPLFHIILGPTSPWALSQACPVRSGLFCRTVVWILMVICWCGVRLGTPVCLGLLERLLWTTGAYGQSILQHPPSVQWSDRTKEPGDGDNASLHGL